MPASHSPGFDSRRPHEFDFFQIRQWPCLRRDIREAFFCHRVRAGSDFQASGAPSGEAGIFLACQKSRRRSHDGAKPCCLRESIFTIGKPPCCHLVSPCGLRECAVWPSVLRRIFCRASTLRRSYDASRRTFEDNTASCSLRVAFVIPLLVP